MEVHKLEVLFLDHDELGADGVEEALGNARFPNRCIYPRVLRVETREIGDWSDDSPLNSSLTQDKEVARLFLSEEDNHYTISVLEVLRDLYMITSPTEYLDLIGKTIEALREK